MSAAATFPCAKCRATTLIKALFLGVNSEPICATCYKEHVPEWLQKEDNLAPVEEENARRN